MLATHILSATASEAGATATVGTLGRPAIPSARGLPDTGSGAPSLVTPPHDERTQRPRLECQSSTVVRETCGHRNFRFIRVPCNKWRCPACGLSRLYRELMPELRLAYHAAHQDGTTLKLLTLTWKGSDQGAQHSKHGQHRRRLDIAHFKQALKRQGVAFDYLRVAELHRRGTVHVHFLTTIPYVRQTLLSDIWRRHARGAVVVDIRALGFKCKACWDPSITVASQRARRIVSLSPSASSATCANCAASYSASDAAEATITAGLWEIGKYLVKQPLGSLTRSLGWQHFHREALETLKRQKTPSYCDPCGDEHAFARYVPFYHADGQEPYGLAVDTRDPQVSFMGRPCNCWPGAWPSDVLTDIMTAAEADAWLKALADGRLLPLPVPRSASDLALWPSNQP